MSLIIYISAAQIIPIYEYTDYFYTNGGSASLSTTIGTFPNTFPTGFQISTAIYRKPFVALSLIEDLRIENNQALYILTEIITYTPTSFNLQIKNKYSTAYYGLMNNTKIKYRYMIVKNTFPDIYMCKDLKKLNFTFVGQTTNSLSFSLVT